MDANTSRAFGDLLRRLRVVRELTQEGLAEAAGLSTRAISDLERGVNRTPRRDTMLLLADALELSPSERERFERAGRRLLPAPDRAKGDSATPLLHNLPSQLTSFVGRKGLVEQIRSTLLLPDVRLLTLTGAGGTGKTRLGLQIAAELLDRFEDGVFFVDLSAVADPSLVPAEIARSLSVAESGGRPMLDILTEYLHDKEILLVLDNFEQVVGAAPAVSRLLAAAPGLAVLATSRLPLHVRGEREYPVPPLDLPDPRDLPEPETLSRYAAIELFIARATAVGTDFALTRENAYAIAEICARLDGLPLAIELAAARVKVLPPEALLGRLDGGLGLLKGGARDLPERQRTMRATIDWSHHLLAEEERVLFRRLGVFAGGWTLEAVEAVCNPEGELDVLDILSRLVDHSLVWRDAGYRTEPRFGMLETIREYALERLEESGEAEDIRRGHAGYFAGLAEDADPGITSAGRAAWLERLDAENDNLRAALGWGVGAAESDETGARLVGALTWYWFLRGSFAEGRAWFDRVLARLGSAGASAMPRTKAWARALFGKESLFTVEFDHLDRRLMVDQVAAISREVGDKPGLAQALVSLGTYEADTGDYATGRAHLEESVALARELDDTWQLCRSLGWLGRTTLEAGEYDAASAVYEEGLALARRGEDDWSVAFHLEGQADVAQPQRGPEQAAPLYAEARKHYEVVGDRLGIAACTIGMARAAVSRGDAARAKGLYRESTALLRELAPKRYWYVNVLVGAAGVAVASGDTQMAARLLGAAGRHRENLTEPLPPVARAEYDALVTACKSQLDAGTFEAAWHKGRAMTLEEAIEYALS